jgi:YggT family protein
MGSVSGGAEGNRTPDLVIANDALYQLSYSPNLNLVWDTRSHGWAACARLELLSQPGLATQAATHSEMLRNKGWLYMIGAVFWLIGELIHLYILAIIIAVVISMLISFGVVNAHSRFVYTVSDFLNRLTEPLLRPIRRILPDLGGIDISPLIAILLLEFLDRLLASLYIHLVMAGVTF